MSETFKGVAHPWQCDVLGHLTTRFYTALFDDASYHFISNLYGWPGVTSPSGKLSFVDAKHVINYREEVLAGDLLEISAGLVAVGNKSMTAEYTMTNLRSGEVAATLEAVYVLFDLEKRIAVALDNELRTMAEAGIDG